jgi:arylsulfatase A-like enzyme
MHPFPPFFRASVRLGAIAGAGGGAVTAGGDFGALWLWLPAWDERLLVLARLLASQVPLGALVGAIIGALVCLVGSGWAPTRRPARVGSASVSPKTLTRRDQAWFPVPFVALLLPALVAIAVLLFQGGSASRVPMRPAAIAASVVVVAAGAYGAIRVARRLLLLATTSSARRPVPLLVVCGFVGAYLAASKLDQWAFPNQYGYLHAALAALAWLAATGSVLVVVRRADVARRLLARPGAFAAIALMLTVGFGAHVLTLDHDPNVRVAMFDPRAATSRTIMRALDPIARQIAPSGASAESLAAARRAREDRRARISTGQLPTWTQAHVLLITVDALRADHLGTHGYARPTSPNIDALAAEGVVFEHAYAQAPHSSYSIASLMTGEYVHEVAEMGLPIPEHTVAAALDARDYSTSAFYTPGIFHTEGERFATYARDDFDFERSDHSDQDAESRTDRVLAEIDAVRMRGEPPALIWAHYFDAHEPYRRTHFGTDDMDRYDSEILAIDQAVGRLVRTARERLERDVIVVLTSDHGEEFRDHGGVYHGSTLYEEQVRVPLIWSATDLAPRRVETPVELIDVAPTVLAMVGAAPLSPMRGDDLRPLLVGDPSHPASPVFSAVGSKRMVVRWPHKLILDLRFGLFQVFDLSADPLERHNLARAQPALVESLEGEIHAWLDTVRTPPGRDSAVDPHRAVDPRSAAIARGRLGDRRSVGPLAAIARDPSEPRELRLEALRLLGSLGGQPARGVSAAPGPDDAPAGESSCEHRAATTPGAVLDDQAVLHEVLDHGDPELAAEAAIALGRHGDMCARDALRALVFRESPGLRARAAVALGRLNDAAAVPSLIEAIWAARSTSDREDAIRSLGRIRDGRAVEPLLSMLPEFRTRNHAVLALGQIGDRRAFEPIVAMLEWERNATIRDNVVRALGQLGDPRAVGPLVAVATDEPGLGNTTESLVRLGAVELGAIGGIDFGPRQTRTPGLARCRAARADRTWHYQHRTSCVMSGAAVLHWAPAPSRTHQVELAFRVRREDATEATRVTLRSGSWEAVVSVDAQWHEHRLSISRQLLGPELRVSTSGGARLQLDHALLLPRLTRESG